ncbi:hypothetical protein P168DRAFT_334547 [Aspergillus campestris IBT 28561]|uniref:Velvet domain-containing protein n=1 Tax=Aspergillus campestris (strain IBT 28561) TaxID=1392248 RepID=A0A2I1CVQ3_ASPC2|nr:uncharacterized protein P168DRAFT_334547 [Aspergillus campestris IBT 28561]PKY01706.1 hypothetical protein P168DRAFT_334547 [Aspergillus campestris IBT 28561]
MVQDTTDGSSSSSSSSSREYCMRFEIAPQAAAWPNVPFTLPVIVSVRTVGAPQDYAVQQLAMNVSLRTESGDPVASYHLSGALTSSVRNHDGNTTSGFARFGPLAITQPGRYRLRIALAAASPVDITIKDYIDSDVVDVHIGAVAHRPTPTQISRLQSLVPENLDITRAEMEEWEHACFACFRN